MTIPLYIPPQIHPLVFHINKERSFRDRSLICPKDKRPPYGNTLNKSNPRTGIPKKSDPPTGIPEKVTPLQEYQRKIMTPPWS